MFSTSVHGIETCFVLDSQGYIQSKSKQMFLLYMMQGGALKLFFKAMVTKCLAKTL